MMRQKTVAVCDMLCTIALISFICYFISLLFYIVFIVSLVINRKGALRSSFYVLCLSLALANAWGIIHKFFRLIPNFLDIQDFYLSMGSLLEFFLRIEFTYTAFSSMLGYVFLTFNLYSAVVYPMRLKSWWSPTNLHRCILAQWILPLFLAGLLFLPLGWDFAHMEFHHEKFFSFSASDPHLTVWLAGWAMVQMFISALFIYLNIAIVRSLWKGYKLRETTGSMRSIDAEQRKKRPRGVLKRVSSKMVEKFETGEVRLAMAGIFMSFLQIIVGIHATLCALDWYPNEQFQEIAHTVVHGLYLQANPYIMLFMSSTVRKCFVSVFRCTTVVVEAPIIGSNN